MTPLDKDTLDKVTGGTQADAAKYIRSLLGLSVKEYNQMKKQHGNSDQIFLNEMTVAQQNKYWTLYNK